MRNSETVSGHTSITIHKLNNKLNIFQVTNVEEVRLLKQEISELKRAEKTPKKKNAPVNILLNNEYLYSYLFLFKFYIFF